MVKFFFTSIFIIFSLDFSEWHVDFEEAKQVARENNRFILLNFSGSDWCASCIKMNSDIFSQDVFTEFATVHLVLVRSDFPRSKKNRLPQIQISQNELLAEKYNPHGKFPYTLLLDASGKVVMAWDGYKGMSASGFVNQLQALLNRQ